MQTGKVPLISTGASMAKATITSTAVSNRTAHAALQAPAIHSMSSRPAGVRVCSMANRVPDSEMKDCRVRLVALLTIKQSSSRLG